MTFVDLIVRPPEWMEEANCRTTATPNRFVPPNNGKEHFQPAECVACPVKAQCLAFGRQEGLEGWWGGEYLPDARGAASDRKRFARYRELYDQGLNDLQIGEVTATYPEGVGRWRRKESLPAQVHRRGKVLVNRHGEPCCANGHPTATDSTKRDDGQLLCVTCNFGNVRAA